MSAAVANAVLAIVLLVAAVGMLVYLFAALIRPDKW